ncbi:MAG TPA: PaaI family thioesterase [Solirubrobacteraceae bacterium]|nr:PaaI family thioesterase [Solirubrobacteraceae bacterium]
MSTPPAGFVELTDPGPYLAHVGPLYIRTDGDDSPVLGLCAAPEHCNASGAVHGGLLASLCDTACGHAIRARADDRISGAVTVSLTTDYLAPARAGVWLEACTTVEKLGGRLAFADCSVTADGREVVRARAVFSVLD